MPVQELHFRTLVEQWTNETAFLSCMVTRMSHPAYQQIIEMGSAVLPFLLQELEARPNHWAAALQAITGEDPVPENARGKLYEVTAAWLNWGRERGLIP